MRDLYSGEVARTLYKYGFYKKFQDAGWRDRDRRLMSAQEDPGLADGVFITALGEHPIAAFIECKTGRGTNRERFPFDEWKPRQREFAMACAFSGIPHYLFIVVGQRIGTGSYPRIACLLEGWQFAMMEQALTERKSIPYEIFTTAWKHFLLTWVGGGEWEIPPHHPFWKVIEGTYRGVYSYRDSRLGADGGEGRSATSRYSFLGFGTPEFAAVSGEEPLPPDSGIDP